MRRIDTDWSGGTGWIAHPDEVMERSSHAISGDAGSWLIDPVDAPGLDGFLDEPVAGVVVSFDHHRRDAAAIAARHDIAVHFPAVLAYRAGSMEVPTASLDQFTRDTGWTAHVLRDWFRWHEVALRAPDEETVRIPESVGTARYFRAGDERLGVHPTARLVPPVAALRDVATDRVLVGHGEGIMADGRLAIDEAMTNARRRLPLAYVRAALSVPSLLGDQRR